MDLVLSTLSSTEEEKGQAFIRDRQGITKADGNMLPSLQLEIWKREREGRGREEIEEGRGRGNLNNEP